MTAKGEVNIVDQNVSFHQDLHMQYFGMTMGGIAFMLFLCAVCCLGFKLCGSLVKRERDALRSNNNNQAEGSRTKRTNEGLYNPA